MSTSSENVVVTDDVVEATGEVKEIKFNPDEARQKFIEEANNVEVPVSVGMNSLREEINRVISNSPVHIECMLEVFRSTCTMLEKVASENAEKETNAYYSKINELKEKYGVTD